MNIPSEADSLTPSSSYPETWYAATRILAEQRPRLCRHENTGICVVGAGLAGLSVALELVRLGEAVTVVEAGRIAWGASGRNGGFVSPGFAPGLEHMLQHCGVPLTHRLYNYSVQGTELVRSNIQQFSPASLMGEGKFSVSRYPAGNEMSEYAASLVNDFGDVAEYLPGDRLREIIKTRRYFDAVYRPRGFHIHPLNYALDLAAEFERLGGEIYVATPARALTPSAGENGSEGWHVETDSGAIHAREVVICTSGYDQGLYQPVSRSVLPVATHVAVTEPLNAELSALISTQACIADTSNACDYYRLIDQDRLLWGGKITTLKKPPKALDQEMLAAITDVFPELNQIRIDYSWSGLMGYCRHLMPVIRQPASGLWVATAFGGHGLNTTAMAGSLVASAIAKGDERWRDFDQFGLDWNCGPLGQAAVQTRYWWMQLQDKIKEFRAMRSLPE